MKRKIMIGMVLMLIISLGLITAQSSAFKNNESANGEGTLVNEDGSRSRFSFNVRRNGNGKVTGQATLRNPSFKAVNGQNEQVKIDVSCLKVVGNVAVIGGTTKRKNNQAEAEAIYFAVEDSRETGVDKIFRGFYFDDDIMTSGDVQLCQTLETGVLVLEPIAEGNIQIKS